MSRSSQQLTPGAGISRSRSRTVTSLPPPPTTHEEFFGVKMTEADAIVKSTRQAFGKGGADQNVRAATKEIVGQSKVQSWADYVVNGTPTKDSGVRRPSAAMATPLRDNASVFVESSGARQSSGSRFSSLVTSIRDPLADLGTPFPALAVPPNTPAAGGETPAPQRGGRVSRAGSFFATAFADELGAASDAVGASSSPVRVVAGGNAGASPVPMMPPSALKKRQQQQQQQQVASEISAVPTTVDTADGDGRRSEGRLSGLLHTIRNSLSRLSGTLLGAPNFGSQNIEVAEKDLPAPQDRIDVPDRLFTHQEIFGSRKSVTFASPPRESLTPERPRLSTVESPSRSLSHSLNEAATVVAAASPKRSRSSASSGGEGDYSDAAVRSSRGSTRVIEAGEGNADESLAIKAARLEGQDEASGTNSTPPRGSGGRGVTPPPTPPGRDAVKVAVAAAAAGRSKSPSRHTSPQGAVVASVVDASRVVPLPLAVRTVLECINDADKAEHLTVAQLIACLQHYTVELPRKAKKADLVQLVRDKVAKNASAAPETPAAVEADARGAATPVPDKSWKKADLEAFVVSQSIAVPKSATKEQILRAIANAAAAPKNTKRAGGKK